MLLFLRGLFIVILASMLGVTGWASSQCALTAIPREVFTHPWFIATLFDAYWGFITFYVWLAWKEQALAARVLWFLAVIALGNIAMAAYFLRELFAVPLSGSVNEVFTVKRPGKILLPAVLVSVSVAVYLAA